MSPCNPSSSVGNTVGIGRVVNFGVVCGGAAVVGGRILFLFFFRVDARASSHVGPLSFDFSLDLCGIRYLEKLDIEGT